MISTDDEDGLGPETVDDLLEAVISTAADHPETSKRRIAYHLLDYAQHLEIEADRDDV